MKIHSRFRLPTMLVVILSFSLSIPGWSKGIKLRFKPTPGEVAVCVIPPISRLPCKKQTKPCSPPAETFEAIFPWFAAIARRNAQDTRDAVACADTSGGTHLWDTGHAKVFDNALMGWVHARRNTGLAS